MVSLEKFLDHSKQQQFTWGKIYSMQGELYAVLNEETNDNFIAKVKEFAERFGGHWRVQAKKHHTTSNDGLCKLVVAFSEVEQTSGPLQGAPSHHGPVDVEKIRKDERERIELEYRLKELEKNNKEERQKLLDEIKSLKTNGGKLAYVVDEIINRISPRSAAPAPRLAGPAAEATRTITPKDKENLNKAIHLLFKHAESETILKLAEKVDENPGYILQMKSFLQIQ